MSAFTAPKHVKHQSKVHYSQYLAAEDAPKEDGAAPDNQPINPEQPEAE